MSDGSDPAKPVPVCERLAATYGVVKGRNDTLGPSGETERLEGEKEPTPRPEMEYLAPLTHPYTVSALTTVLTVTSSGGGTEGGGGGEGTGGGITTEESGRGKNGGGGGCTEGMGRWVTVGKGTEGQDGDTGGSRRDPPAHEGATPTFHTQAVPKGGSYRDPALGRHRRRQGHHVPRPSRFTDGQPELKDPLYPEPHGPGVRLVRSSSDVQTRTRTQLGPNVGVGEGSLAGPDVRLGSAGTGTRRDHR